MAARGIGAGATSGLQRLESGRAIVLVDAGPPPDADVNAAAHAGALAFEMSDGEERIIANVGGSPADARLEQVVRTTAAHSTITVDDRNQSHIPETGALGTGVDQVEISRQESEEGQWLDMCHDGYRRRFGLMHHRRLFLAAGGTDLRGEDVLSGAGRKAKSAHPFALRFHLTPGTDVAPTADGKGAVLKTAKGRMWQFKLSGGTLVVDDSLWIGEDGGLNRSRQLAVTGESALGDTVLRWRFNKVR
nr:heparinase II/III family protein [Pacificimonas pallii]